MIIGIAQFDAEAQAVLSEVFGTVTPSGTLDITSNGEHDVAEYEKVNVNVQ